MRWLRNSPLILIITCILTAWSSIPAKAEQPSTTFIVEVADMAKSAELVKVLKAKGINAVIFPKNMMITGEQNNRAVWLGKNVPLKMVRETLTEALRIFPLILYIHVVGDKGEKPPEKVHDTIHLGGSMEAAQAINLAMIPAKELQQMIDQAKTIEELHKSIRAKNGIIKASIPAQSAP